MNKYETVFIISPTLEEEAVKGLVEKFSNLISANGELEKVEEWGKKKFAYEVQDHKEGYYVLITSRQIQISPQSLKEISRSQRVS